MMRKAVVTSLSLMGTAILFACSSDSVESPPPEPIAQVDQAVVGPCTMNTVGMPCDPDGPTGPKLECFGVCRISWTGLPFCAPAAPNTLDGLACGTATGVGHAICQNRCQAGACVNIAAAAGAGCRPQDSSSPCDGACNGAGVCVPVAQPCAHKRDVCEFKTCDLKQVTSCKTVALGAGTICSTGDKCTVGQTCDASGSCGGGGPKDCDDNNVCTDDICDPTDGACIGLPNTNQCSDGDACTLGDKCSGGHCLPTVRSTVMTATPAQWRAATRSVAARTPPSIATTMTRALRTAVIRVMVRAKASRSRTAAAPVMGVVVASPELPAAVERPVRVLVVRAGPRVTGALALPVAVAVHRLVAVAAVVAAAGALRWAVAVALPAAARVELPAAAAQRAPRAAAAREQSVAPPAVRACPVAAASRALPVVRVFPVAGVLPALPRPAASPDRERPVLAAAGWPGREARAVRLGPVRLEPGVLLPRRLCCRCALEWWRTAGRGCGAVTNQRNG